MSLPLPTAPPETVDDAHHADNQRRFIALETKIDQNTTVTEKLATDTAELVEMWKDAGVFFKWMRKAGAVLMWLGKVAVAVGALYGAGHYWGGPK